MSQQPTEPSERNDTDRIDTNRTRPAARSQTQPMPRARDPKAQGQHMQPTQGRTPPPQRYRARPPKTRTRQQESGLYLPWWSLVVMLLGVMVIALGIIGIILLLGNRDTLAEPTPIIRVITSAPTLPPVAIVENTAPPPATEIISGGAEVGALALEGPTLAPVIFTPTPVSVQVGGSVRVEGVDEQMLNVRSTPTLSGSSVLFRADEGSIFTVLEGPTQSDGFTWWRIQDPNDPNRDGWAVSNFLTGISLP